MLNLSELNTKKPAEKGAFLHLCHPVSGAPLYDGEDKVGLTLRGVESETVQKTMKKLNRKQTRRQNTEIDDEIRGIKFAMSLVMEFHHMENDKGEELDASNQEHVKWFFDQSSDFVIQVTEFAAEAANFMKAD